MIVYSKINEDNITNQTYIQKKGICKSQEEAFEEAKQEMEFYNWVEQDATCFDLFITKENFPVSPGETYNYGWLIKIIL